MMQFFSRKSRRPRSTTQFTTQRPFSHKHLTHEQLEPRMMLSINPTGSEFLVNDKVPGFQGIDENVSSVAVSEGAGMLATYAGLGAGKREGIFLRRYDLDGVARSDESILVSDTIRGERSGAVVAANTAGNTVVVWQGRGLGDKYGIYLQRFDAAGSKLGDEQLVNETTGGKQHDPAVAMAADGSFVVTWSGPTGADPAGIFARRFAADGTALAGEELVNSTTAGQQIESSVAADGSGDFVVTWSSRNQDATDWDVFAQRFSSTGARQGDEFQVNTTSAASQRESSVAMQDDGTFMVVWSSFGQDGDSWTVVAQRFDATGTAVGGEIVVNTTTTDHQRHAQVAGAGGSYLVTWQSGVLGIGGWEVMSQEFDATGNRVGSELLVNSPLNGTSSGHQQHPAAALNAAGNGAVIWSGYGTSDRRGVFGRVFQDDDVQTEPNLTPDLATIDDQTVAPNTEMVITVTATDPNVGDTLTYQIDPTNSPAGATIEKTSNNTAIIRWTPTDADKSSVVNFRVLVTDDGEPPLADAEEFQVNVTDGSITLDLNGSDEAGADEEVTFFIGRGAVSIVDDDLLIVGAANDSVERVTAQLTEAPNGSRETLEVDTQGTNIVATYTTGLRRLLLSGTDTAENYERVLRTLRYNNTAANASGTRIVEIQVNDASHLSNRPKVSITIGTADLVGFAQALAESDTEFFGAAWCPACTAQKELFEDGGQFLPFTEVTNSDRSRNQVGDDNDIEFYPTWVFPDETRLEGAQTLETLSQRSGVAIPVSNDPFVAPIADDTLLVGSPLHVSLDGYDPNGGPLTYSVTTNNSAVTAEILSGNRSARINVEGFGDLVFELFEQRASRPTDRFIELANDDFFDNIIFHRVIDDFVIQGGDPLGTGTGGSTLGDFDDQFHVDLQHNRTGLLSYAKSLEDTGDSQFFITEGVSSTRNLDFHHSIFGVLVEGEANRAAISDTEVIRRANEVPQGDRRADRPGVRATEEEFNITMENVEIFDDTENAVLFLKADPGATGTVTVTVTVEDQQGNTSERVFTLTLQNDTVNGRPFINNIVAPATVTRGTTAQIQLSGVDVEGDAFIFSAEEPAGNTVPYTFTIDQNGQVDITLTDQSTGTLQITVLVARPGTDLTLSDRFRDPEIDRQLITIEVVA